MIEGLFSLRSCKGHLIKLGPKAINSRNTSCIPTRSDSDKSTLERIGWFQVGGKVMVMWDD